MTSENPPNNIKAKLCLLLVGIAVASVGFLYLISLLDRQTEKREAARSAQWGFEMARQEQFFHDLRGELKLRAADPLSVHSNAPALSALQPALVLKDKGAYLLSTGGLQRIASPIDTSAIKSVVVTVHPARATASEMIGAAPAAPELRLHVFSWPKKNLIVTEEFSGQPEGDAASTLHGLPMDVSTLGLRERVHDVRSPTGSREQIAEARMDYWLTNGLTGLGQRP